ncbi:hypothetical protein G8V30_15775, partial [Clostridium botulinum C/D]|nr:hypothetical protein [Clostridium botulinum C/D]
FHMYVVPMSSNVKFRVVEEEQNQDQAKPTKPTKPVEKPKEKPKENQTKPDTKPTTKPTTEPTDSQVKPEEKPTGNEVKPNKPEEKPVKPVDVTTKPDDNKPKSEETKVKIKTIKAENDEPSMSGTYLEKEAKYIKENGKIYCEIKLLAVDWMRNIKIDADGNEVKHTVKETGK